MTVRVKVLRGYDGFTAQVVDTIERKTVKRGGYKGRGRDRYYEEPSQYVSYAGRLHKVFSLPACYDELHGMCIAE